MVPNHQMGFREVSLKPKSPGMSLKSKSPGIWPWFPGTNLLDQENCYGRAKAYTETYGFAIYTVP
jgi:hypothetical protein